MTKTATELAAMPVVTVEQIIDFRIAALDSVKSFAGLCMVHEDVNKELADQVKELQANEWVSVEDRLPENKLMVLMVGINKGQRGDYTTDMYTGWHDGEWVRWVHSFDPTHWMPLPSPPGEGS